MTDGNELANVRRRSTLQTDCCAIDDEGVRRDGQPLDSGRAKGDAPNLYRGGRPSAWSPLVDVLLHAHLASRRTRGVGCRPSSSPMRERRAETCQIVLLLSARQPICAQSRASACRYVPAARRALAPTRSCGDRSPLGLRQSRRAASKRLPYHCHPWSPRSSSFCASPRRLVTI